MKKTLILFPLAAIIFSCTATRAQIVGNDMQDGCKGSAGYQWSQLKNECIRPFEEGIKLNSVMNPDSAGYLIFKDDEVEIFSIETPSSMILQKEEDEIWRKGDWEIIHRKKEYSLKKGGKTLYEN